MMAAQRYSAFGLSILSDFRLPELIEEPDTSAPQITIRAGAVPADLPERTARSGLFQVSAGRLLLSLSGIARYLVQDGASITIDSAPGSDEDSLRLFLLGSAFGALLHQRGLSPLHASAIETAKGAVIFGGWSGTGKSALAAAFHTRGYPVISDEICAISAGLDRPAVLPSFPRLLLWPDIVAQLGFSSASLRPARPNLTKFHVPLLHGFSAHPVPIHALYMLKTNNRSQFAISRVSPLEGVQALVSLTFRRSFLQGMCSVNGHFRQVTSLAQSVPISNFSRPEGERRIQESADVLEEDFNR